MAALLGTADELNSTAGLALAEFHEYWNDGWGEEDDMETLLIGGIAGSL